MLLQKCITRREDQRDGIALTAEHAPIPGARPELLEVLKQRGAAVTPPSDKVWTDRVRHALRPLLLREEPTSFERAAYLKMNVRTLSRRKARASRNFWMRCVSPWRGNCSPSRIWRSAISPRLSPIPRILPSWMPCGDGAASCLRIGGARLDPFWARRKAIPHAIALAAADVRNGSSSSVPIS